MWTVAKILCMPYFQGGIHFHYTRKIHGVCILEMLLSHVSLERVLLILVNSLNDSGAVEVLWGESLFKDFAGEKDVTFYPPQETSSSTLIRVISKNYSLNNPKTSWPPGLILKSILGSLKCKSKSGPYSNKASIAESLACTLPETNIAPENRPLEKEIPIGNHYFQVLC